MLRFVNLVDKSNRWIANVVRFIVLAVMLTGVYEVTSRYIFNRPTIWVWETNGLLLCLFVALAGGFTLLVEGHVRVDIFYTRLSPRKKAIVSLLTSPFMFLFLGILLWHGIPLSWESLQGLERSHTTFYPYIFPFKIMLVVGIFLFLMQGLANVVRNFVTLTGKEEGNEH